MIKINNIFSGTIVLLLFLNCDINVETIKLNKVAISQNFEIGKKYLYEIQREKIDSRKPGSEKIKSFTEVEFKILAQKKLFKECSWKYGTTKINGVNADQIDEQTKKMINIYKGLEVKFLIDKDGVIQEITNFEECKLILETCFDEMIKIMISSSQTKITQEKVSNIKKSFKSTYESSEVLISTYCPELTVFFTIFGESFKPDSLYISHSDLPNPFGGRSFPTNITTKIDTVTDNFVLIKSNQIIPTTELNSIMKETIEKISTLSDKPVNGSKIPKFNLIINSTYNFNHKKNILEQVYSEKLIESDGVKQKQTIRVILKN